MSELKTIAIALALSIGFISSVIGLSYWIKSVRCEGQSVSFTDHRYEFITGCMVQHNGRWLPLENIKGFDNRD